MSFAGVSTKADGCRLNMTAVRGRVGRWWTDGGGLLAWVAETAVSGVKNERRSRETTGCRWVSAQAWDVGRRHARLLQVDRRTTVRWVVRVAGDTPELFSGSRMAPAWRLRS
ncbi:hypothetical protein Salat_0619600 [Sesamum alatum]|uniref:Uncharacterized protein n=1 Tax=Sesamum alatum TaxID=300844 RepID=A0AAE2CU56_9LAMI|nr:hypothetical protein Salat_0619600 [Sesamum alatum]